MKKKLQIFVSSTFNDMIDERQAAVEAILKAGHIPAGMELFAAGDVSQMETIKKWIDSSDIYMLILGGRYGSMEPKNIYSYTELEYNYAVKKKKPLFAVVIREEALEYKIKINGSKVLEKDNPEKYSTFREKVLNKTSSFFNDAKDIKLAIYESINELYDKYQFKGWVSGEYAKTEEELEKINEMHEYINKLEKELSEVQKRLDKDTSHLAQGADKFEIEIKIRGFEQKVIATWDEVFLVIAKQCIGGDYKNIEHYVKTTLAGYIGKLIHLNNIDAITKDEAFLDNFERIRIQFLALELIDISTKTYTEKNIVGAFWSLTSRGRRYFTDLTAMKR